MIVTPIVWKAKRDKEATIAALPPVRNKKAPSAQLRQGFLEPPKGDLGVLLECVEPLQYGE